MTIGLDTGQQFNTLYDALMGNERPSTSPLATRGEAPTSEDSSEHETTSMPYHSLEGRSFVLIRHGDTHYTEDSKEHGWSQEKLTPKGKEEVENMSLANKPDFLVTSDLPRTVQTAQILAKQHDIPVVEKSEAMRTWDIGHFQGMGCDEAKPVLDEFVRNPDKQVPGGESFNQFKTRVLGGVEDLMSKYPEGNMGIVAHSKVQRLLDATEAGNWQHVDADHFNEQPEAPGKEKTMTLGGYEGMRPSTNVEDYRNESELHKLGEQFRLQAVRFMHDPIKFIMHPGSHADMPYQMSANDNDEGVGTEGEIKNFKYGIPSAGAGRVTRLPANQNNPPPYEDVPETPVEREMSPDQQKYQEAVERQQQDNSKFGKLENELTEILRKSGVRVDPETGKITHLREIPVFKEPLTSENNATLKAYDEFHKDDK